MQSIKRKTLEQCLPEGQIVNRAWLKAQGFSRPQVDYYLRSGKLEPVAQGVYRRPGPPLKWEHVVYSLDAMGYRLRVGGRSALEMQGLAHYLPAGHLEHIDLYGPVKVPGWVSNYPGSFRFKVYNRQLFVPLPEEGYISKPFGFWDWSIPYSTVELAMLELLARVSDQTGFSVADKFFEAAVNFRPNLLQILLRACINVKAKRLFLWFADRHNHAWRQELETKEVDLGKGKRMIIKGGAYNAPYQITVPRELTSGSEQPLY